MTYQNDGLNQTMTEIAIDIIQGRKSELYLETFKSMIKNVPGTIEDVNPKYREKLKEVLDDNYS